MVTIDVRLREQLNGDLDRSFHSYAIQISKSKTKQSIVSAITREALPLQRLAKALDCYFGILPNSLSPIVVNPELNASVIVTGIRGFLKPFHSHFKITNLSISDCQVNGAAHASPA